MRILRREWGQDDGERVSTGVAACAAVFPVVYPAAPAAAFCGRAVVR